MNVTIVPKRLHGAVTPPPSKSQAHRAVIGAALANGKSKVYPLNSSEDIEATLACMEAMGCTYDRGTGEITGIQTPPHELPQLNCGESGSTLRFLIPVALALCGGGRFYGRGRLMARPQGPYFRLFDEKKITYRQGGDELEVQGTLLAGTYRLPGDVSSQFVTGLLFALPLIQGDSEIILESELQSKDYVEMTLKTLQAFGIRIERTGMERFVIPGGQTYHPATIQVEADYSQAAFFAVAKALGSELTIDGLNPDSAQGDRVIFPILDVLSGPGNQSVDVGQCPDLVPAISLFAALREGEITRIENALRLRDKESDRLRAVTDALNCLGAKIEEGPDYLQIYGVNALKGGSADSQNDHRIAMMLAIAATRAQGPVTVLDAQSVRKSYPDFWQVYESLGGDIKRSDQ